MASSRAGLLFPGQGSQFVGMGRELAEAYPEAREVFQRADEILGIPLSRIAWEGPEEELVRTKHAQPAILVHSLAVFRVVGRRLGSVALAAGHSLGEFSAYVAAGALSFEDAVRAVQLRGDLMYRAGEERPGIMAAVLGLGDAEVERICREASGDAGICVPANFNSAGQVVVSGDVLAIAALEELAKDAGAKRVLRLNVSGAFHSPLMKPAERGLRDFLQEVPFGDPSFPVVSNVSAEPVRTGTEARELLVRQLTSPVRWAASIGAMWAAGIDRFFELGPGSVLCGLNRRNARDAACRSLGTPEALAQTEDA